MKSANSFNLLDLDHDLPTTWDDIQALRRARMSRPMSFAAYIEFLALFPSPSNAALRARKGPTGPETFRLE